MDKEIIIYTDGSSLGNPGPGGWAAILISGRRRLEISEGYNHTTNNRMEILAAIEALSRLKKAGSKVILHSDSQLLTDTINKGWLENWKRKGWKRSGNNRVLNRDLWERLDKLLEVHNVRFKWVPAHVGITENERCDELSKQSAASPNKKDDVEYLLSLQK